MVKKPFLVLVATVVVITLHASAVLSCSCLKQGSGIDAVDYSDTVFLGQVVAIQDIYIQADGDVGGYQLRRAVFFRVKESWKGKSAPVIVVYTGCGAGDCGYVFKKGKTYLVFADRLPRSERKILHEQRRALYTDTCTYTAPQQQAEAVIRELRARRPSVTYDWPVE